MQFQFNKEWLIPSGVGVGAFGLGVGVGYFLCQRKFKSTVEEYEEDIETVESNLMELDFTQEGYRAEITNEDTTPPVEIVTDVEEFIQSVIEEPVTTSVFNKEDDDDWNYDKELQERENLDPKAPYIIHRDEFEAEEEGYRQTTLTYYSGDGILVDESDTPIYNFEKVVGELLFGHGSRDQNVVYVRNPEHQAEYEILLDSGMYQVEVLGQEIEDKYEDNDLKHSHMRKFRASD